MKLLDPSTLLLEIVSEPIKEHLRSRNDTLRCIVSSIIADEDCELYEQLGHTYTRIPLPKAANKRKSQNQTKQPEG
jgi:hypothetical protein